MIDENLARLRAHRNNIHRYRRLLATHLSEVERTYIQNKLREEQEAFAALMQSTFPLKLPASAEIASSCRLG